MSKRLLVDACSGFAASSSGLSRLPLECRPFVVAAGRQGPQIGTNDCSFVNGPRLASIEAFRGRQSVGPNGDRGSPLAAGRRRFALLEAAYVLSHPAA